MGKCRKAILFNAESQSEHNKAVDKLMLARDWAQQLENKQLEGEQLISLGDAFEPIGRLEVTA